MWKNRISNDGGHKTEDIWTSCKELYSIVNCHLCEEGTSSNITEFENVLRKHKQNFFTLLQNPPKNAKSREELKKAMEDGIALKEFGHQVLSRDIYQEMVVLSDMYDLNELTALDLLCTAQIRMPYYYGLPRGLVAVLLYYDARKCLVSSLRLLVQARKGVTWNMNINSEISKIATNYTNNLRDNGLFTRIFELLHTLDLNKEIEKLQDNLALGGPKHRKQVINMFIEIRECLAETVHLWSAQCGLLKEHTIALINFLKTFKIEEDANGIMDNVSFFLMMALLSAMDLSILQIREDGEEVVQNLPIVSEKDFIQTLCNELTSTTSWANEGLHSIALFSLSITVACVHILPQHLEIQTVEKENVLCSTAIKMKVFEFLLYKVLPNEIIYKDEIVTRRLHYLITDFIVQMFAKVKELRIDADETARVMQIYMNEGIEPPTNLPRHFEQFMNVIAKFYSKDPLNLQYSLEFWCPTENNLRDSVLYQTSTRSVSLSKFVKLAGDLVPSTLFVSFLEMLSSLSTSAQGARHCFNLLKRSGSGYNSSISWDHFFMSFAQYYNNLRQEAPVINEPFRRLPQLKGITPQEVKGLQAVLQLIKTIAEYDDFSRLALCEHPGWAPLTILLGLVSCSVPIPLKGSLLLTLAALAKSPETATELWNNLEASQIVVTIPTTSSYQSKGIQTELDEIESRMEEYPLTRALLTLLDVLTDSGIPRTLGAGPRKPGFDPYLTFIVNSVFLKFSLRPYKNLEERWLVGSQCLKLLEKFLLQYEPQASDFPNGNKPNEFNSPPGFHLMLQLNSKSEFLNLLLLILEEGHKIFQQNISSQKYPAECTERCLNVLERALFLQNTFFQLLSTSSTPILLTNLNKLLLSINPRSGQPDHCLNMSKYLSYNYSLPKHTLASAKILLHLTSWPAVHSKYLSILLSSETQSKIIRNSFVECLDCIVRQEDENINKSKEVLMKILKQCLPYNTPNLTHFLLGFDLKQDLSLTIFQQPGVLGFPRTCIHSLFLMLKTAVSRDVHFQQPANIVESVYHTLYLLCGNYKISEPVLRFLRQNQRFFQDHLFHCLENANNGLSQLNQLSWLLKTIAIELKIVSSKNQMSYLQQLVILLVGKSRPDIVLESFSITSNALNMDDTFSETLDNNVNAKMILKLLDKFDLNVEELLHPHWEYLNINVLQTLLNDCQTIGNPKLIDIKKLHHTLIDEIGALHGSANVGHRQAVIQEIEKVLLHCISVNNMRNTAASINRFVESWRQVVEVLAIYLPFEVLSPKDQQLLNICLLKHICHKMIKQSILPEVAQYLSGTVVILMENTRRCYLKQKQQQIANKIEDNQMFNALQVCTPHLKLILNYIIEWIMLSNSSSQNLRFNLYTSLVIFLKLINQNESISNVRAENNSFYISRLDNSKMNLTLNDSLLTSFNLSSNVFSAFGEKLINSICQDCIDGQHVVKMLAMSTYSLLISLSKNMNWIMCMENKGYLKHIIQSILSSDSDLLDILNPSPRSMKPFYLHISKMSILTQLAATRFGAELLLEQRALACFNSMKVFSSHPDILKADQTPLTSLETFIPPVERRFLQIFVPTLHLCDSIITSLSTDNSSAVSQIMCFLFGHLDVIELILRSGNPLLTENFLEELSSLTSVISRIASADLSFMNKNPENSQENNAHWYRIQKLMLSLLPKFLLTEDVIKQLLIRSHQNSDPTYQQSDRLLYVFKILTNLVTYATNTILNNKISDTSFQVLFGLPVKGAFISFRNNTNRLCDQIPTLEIIMQHLIFTVSYYHTEKGTLDFLQQKLTEIPDMNTGDLKEFLKLTHVYDMALLRESAIQLATEKFVKKKKEFDYLKFIIENLLFVLWTHVDYYMLKTIPKTKKDVMEISSNYSLEGALDSSEAAWKDSTNDINNIKQGLVAVFNDSFSRQLLETAQGGSETNAQFLEVLLRKIKRLIQFVPVQ